MLHHTQRSIGPKSECCKVLQSAAKCCKVLQNVAKCCKVCSARSRLGTQIRCPPPAPPGPNDAIFGRCRR
eukprot:gene14014-biopygen17066